jgi:hypothetical protein
MVSQTGNLDREGQAQPPGGLSVNRVATLAFLLALIHQSAWEWSTILLNLRFAEEAPSLLLWHTCS